jgi:hypothetical protein
MVWHLQQRSCLVLYDSLPWLAAIWLGRIVTIFCAASGAGQQTSFAGSSKMAPTKEENEAGYFRPKVDEAAMCLFDRFLALTNLEMEAIVEPHFNWSLQLRRGSSLGCY